MNYANIKYFDIANGVGVRTSLFVSGCRNCCEDCFNRETWDFNYGKPFTNQTELDIINSIEPDYIAGLTILGGEPMERENQLDVLNLVKNVKKRFPNKTVWIFSGFTYEELLSGTRASTKEAKEILSIADILVDGRFEKDKKNISLKFRGSENQRIIDLNKTKECGEIVFWQEK